MSGSPGVVHFGLGDSQVVELEISWPSGETRQYPGLPINSSLLINEAEGVTILWQKELVTSSASLAEQSSPIAYPTVFRDEIKILGILPNRPVDARLINTNGKSWDLSFTSTRESHSMSFSHLNLNQGLYLLRLGVGSNMHTFKLWRSAP